MKLALSLVASAAAFTPGNVLLYRVGSDAGTTALSSSYANIFFDEYNPVTLERIGSPVGALPNCSVGGTTMEAAPSINVDGSAVAFVCWGGVAGGSGATTYAVGRLRVDGSIDYPKSFFTSLSSGMRSASISSAGGLYVGTSSGMKYATITATSWTSVTGTSNSSIRGVAWHPSGAGLFVAHFQPPTPGIANIGTPTATSACETTFCAI